MIIAQVYGCYSGICDCMIVRLYEIVSEFWTLDICAFIEMSIFKQFTRLGARLTVLHNYCEDQKRSQYA